jgi:hypothetical protein
MGFVGAFELEVHADVLTDTDSDGMQDSWETANGLAVGVNDGDGDLDSDGLSNAREFYSRTNPNVADTDGDGLSDGAEANIHFTSPATADTDADGLTDNAELTTHSTNPSAQDTDGDGLEDGVEVCGYLTLPTIRDSDGDGFSDGLEIQLGTNPLSAASRAANIARAGSPLLGFNLSTETNLNGFHRINPVMSGSVNDGNLVLRTDNVYALNSSATHAHVGILWAAPWTHPVRSLELFLARQSLAPDAPHRACSASDDQRRELGHRAEHQQLPRTLHRLPRGRRRLSEGQLSILQRRVPHARQGNPRCAPDWLAGRFRAESARIPGRVGVGHDRHYHVHRRASHGRLGCRWIDRRDGSNGGNESNHRGHGRRRPGGWR